MVHATSQSASTEKNVKPCIETDTEEVNHKNQTKLYLSESESGDEYDEDLENAVSECSYQTATTSSVADTDISNICDQLLVLSTTNHKSMGSTRGKKKRGKTAKKAKKANRAQKITEEEIEAIKKMKKLDADKAYELRQEQMKIRQEKIDASDRNKIYRRLAQTAVDMLRKEERKLPPEIKQLDEDLEYYVENSKFYLRINLRDRYLETRVDEISEKYIGPALEHKTELLKIYEDLIKRSLQAFRLFMFLKTLNEKSVDYTKFEVLTLSFVMKGFEDDWLEVNGTYEENESYLSFEKNILHDIPETDQHVNAAEFVMNKLIYYAKKDDDGTLNLKECHMKEAYTGAGQLIAEYKQCTNAIAFLQDNRENLAYNLMEEWFLVSRKPSPIVL